MQALGPAKRHCPMREEQSTIKYCSKKEWFSSSENANNYTKANI